MDLQIQLTPEDLGDQLYWQEEDELIRMIKRLDTRWGEVSFTKRLIHMLADQLREEGLTVGIEILEG